ncbi:MAG: hypothetical protein V3W34_01105, partial [Phycisphaerae bacterium]
MRDRVFCRLVAGLIAVPLLVAGAKSADAAGEGGGPSADDNRFAPIYPDRANAPPRGARSLTALAPGGGPLAAGGGGELIEIFRQPVCPTGTQCFQINTTEGNFRTCDSFNLLEGGALAGFEFPISQFAGDGCGGWDPDNPGSDFFVHIWADEGGAPLPEDEPIFSEGPFNLGDGFLTTGIDDTIGFGVITFTFDFEAFIAAPGTRYYVGFTGTPEPPCIASSVLTSFQPARDGAMFQAADDSAWGEVEVGDPSVFTEMGFALFAFAPTGGTTVLSMEGISAGGGCSSVDPNKCCIRVTPTVAPVITCNTSDCDPNEIFGTNCFTEAPLDPGVNAEQLAAALAASLGAVPPSQSCDGTAASCNSAVIEAFAAGPRLIVKTTDGTKPKLCVTINCDPVGIMGGPNDCALLGGCGFDYRVGPCCTLPPIAPNVDRFATVRGQCDLPPEDDTGTWINLDVPGSTFDRTPGASPASGLVVPRFRLEGVARDVANDNSDTVIRRTDEVTFGRCSGDFSREGADPTLQMFLPDGVADQFDVDAFNECVGTSDPFPGDCEFFDYDGDDVITSNLPLSGVDDDRDVLDCLLLAGNSPECCPSNLNLPQRASNLVITEMARWHLRGCDYLQVEREGSLWPENWVLDIYLSAQDPGVGLDEVGPCENEFDAEVNPVAPPLPDTQNDVISIADNIGLVSEGEPRRIAGELGNSTGPGCDFFNFHFGDMDADVYRFTLAFPASVNISTDAVETDPKCELFDLFECPDNTLCDPGDGSACDHQPELCLPIGPALPSLWLYSSSGLLIASDDPPASRFDPTIINREPSISKKLDEGEFFILVAAAGQIVAPDPTDPTGRRCSIFQAPEVDFGEGDPTGLYDLNIAVAPSSTLRVTKDSDTDGTYEARTLVQPLYTYQKVGDPFQSTLIDTGERGDDAFVLQSTGPWTNALPEASDLRPSDLSFIPGVLPDGSAPEIQLIETNEGNFGQRIVAGARRFCATIFDACGDSQEPDFDMTLEAVTANFVGDITDTPVADNFSVDTDTEIANVTFWVTPGGVVTDEYVFVVRVLGNAAAEGACEIGIPDGSNVITEGVVGVPFIQPTVSAVADRVTLNLATPFTALAGETYWLELKLDSAQTIGEAVQFVTSLQGNDGVGVDNDNVFFHDVVSQAGQEDDNADDCAPVDGDGYDCVASFDDTETECDEEDPDGDQRIGGIAFCMGAEAAEDFTKELPTDVICGSWRTAPGEIVWSQPFRLRDDGTVGFFSDFTRGTQGGNQGADSFTFFENGTITGIKWHGTYTTNTPVPESDDFRIEFWDDGASVPGTLITSYSPTNAEIERVAGEISRDPGRQVYSYSYQLSPKLLEVQANETVWVSVINNTEGQPYVWAFAIGGGGNSDGRAALRVNLDNDPAWETLPGSGDPPTDFSFEIQLAGATKIVTGDSVDCGGGTASGVGYHFDSLRASINGYQIDKPEGQIGGRIETTGNRWRNVSAPWKFMQHLDAGGENDLAVLFGQLHEQVKNVFVEFVKPGDPPADPPVVTVTQAEIDCLTAAVPGEKSIQSIFAGLAAYDTDPETRGISVGGTVNRLCDGAAMEALDPTLALHERLMVKGVCWDNGTATVITSTGAPECAASGFAEPAFGTSFSDRAWDGYVDSRRESNDGNAVNQGLDTITIEFTAAMRNAGGAPISAAAFSISDTAGTPPTIDNVTSSDGGKTVTLELSGQITLQQWTTFSFDGENSCNSEAFSGSIDIGFLPCDVNQDGRCNPLDVT